MNPFRRRTTFWLVGISALSFTVTLVLFLLGGPLTDLPSPGPHAYSVSAIGHRLLVELLKERGIPVVVSRHDSASRAGATAILVVAEPRIDSEEGPAAETLGRMLDRTGKMLLVLPKWVGSPDETRPGWLSAVELVPLASVEAVLRAADLDDAILRLDAGSSCRWPTRPFGVSPSLVEPQLIRPGSLRPLIACEHGILLGESMAHESRLFVLSDPDVLSNHGLARGGNATLCLSLLEELREGTGAVVIDETMHGREVPPSLWRELFEYPLVLSLLQAFLTVGILLWATVFRFGSPVPLSPALDPGKGSLIENTAEILRFGGYSGRVLVRYLETTIQDVGHALHAPSNLGPKGLRDWLQRLGEARGIRTDLWELEKVVKAMGRRGRGTDPGIVRTAYRVYLWREELLHGRAVGPEHGRTPA